jgi:hypothetical protein
MPKRKERGPTCWETDPALVYSITCGDEVWHFFRGMRCILEGDFEGAEMELWCSDTTSTRAASYPF